VALLVETGQITRILTTYPVSAHSQSFANAFERRYQKGDIALEMVPYGTLVERIRCGGAGIGGVYLPTGAGTIMEKGKEKRVINGKEYLLEMPLKADFSLLKAHKADRIGNLTYRGVARSMNPVMATAAAVAIVEAEEIV
jgi:3-oxoadipate CoA-transferase alpha subunit